MAGSSDSDTASTDRAYLTGVLADVARKDQEALHRLHDLTSAKLFGICLRISGERQAAEDILQNVYLKIWDRAERFNPTRASPITWLATIARNTAIDWRRANSRHPSADTEDAATGIADDRPAADMLIEQSQASERLHHCLDELDERPRSAIRAAFFGGFTYAELARRADVPLGTMKSWMRRSFQRLKACIEHG